MGVKTKAPAKRTEGSRLLNAIGDTQDQIAACCGVTSEAVNQWISGKTRPAKAKREILYREYGVPAETWDREAGAPKSPVAAEPAKSVDKPQRPASAEELVRQALEELDAMPEGDLSPQHRLRRAMTRAQCAQILARQTGEGLEISDAKLVRMPAFRRILETLRDAVHGVTCPKCRADVGLVALDAIAAALEKVE